MPMTGYDEDAARIHRGRGPWWRKWLFVAVAAATAAISAVLLWLLKGSR
jgi:hypothetical protein